MIEKALQFLVKTAQDAATPKLLCEDDRTARYAVGGKIEVVPKVAPFANHHVRSLEDLVAVATEFDAYYGDPNSFSVWHAPDEVIVVLDNADRRDVVRFRLDYSEPFMWLRSLVDDRPALGQREFIELLEVEFGVDRAIIAPFRRLDWDQVIRASGEVTQTKDRMGREITAQVAGTAELPEDLIVAAPVYRVLGERELYAVRCFIRLRPQDQRIVLRPLPGEIDTVVQQAQGSIRDRLQKMLPAAPIFYGSP